MFALPDINASLDELRLTLIKKCACASHRGAWRRVEGSLAVWLHTRPRVSLFQNIFILTVGTAFVNMVQQAKECHLMTPSIT